MNKIKSIQDLKFEIKRLEELSTKHKVQIKSNAEKLKESLHPLNILVGIITTVSGRNKRYGFSKEDLINKAFTLIKRWFFSSN